MGGLAPLIHHDGALVEDGVVLVERADRPGGGHDRLLLLLSVGGGSLDVRRFRCVEHTAHFAALESAHLNFKF